MTFLWATRGRTWGFRFLRDGNLDDPLPIYERAFQGAEDEPEILRRVHGMAALRFRDPLTRRDASGRVIAHDFVVFPPLSDEFETVEDGRGALWPLVAQEYLDAWELPHGPATER